MRDGTVPHGPALLADRRVRIVNADILMAVAEARSTYDLVLLDVDNGPGYLVHAENAGVYEADFLRRCRDVLNPGGVLVVWSANPAPALAASMREVFGAAEEQAHDVLLQDRPEQYYLYLARHSDVAGPVR
jgi:spermidine synthase